MTVDAELLARLVRADRLLLSPVKHRGEEAQADLMGVRVRAQLVELRTQTVNAVRGLVNTLGLLCDGSLRGLFDRPSTITADPTAPAVDCSLFTCLLDAGPPA